MQCARRSQWHWKHRPARPGRSACVRSSRQIDDGTDSAQLAESEQWVGCVSVTQPQYRDLLLTAGFTTISRGPGSEREILVGYP